jgi:hypothetical protein
MVVSDSTYKRQKSEANKFLTFSKLTIDDFRMLNGDANRFDSLIIAYLRSKNLKLNAGIKNLIPTGLKRLFVESNNGGVKCDLDFDDLILEVAKWLGEFDTNKYSDVISQDLFPSPLEQFQLVEKVEGQLPKDCAFLGHYIKVGMKASEFLHVLGKQEFDFNMLGNLLSEFFDNAAFFTEDFLNENVIRIAFRMEFVGGAYTSDDSNDEFENQVMFVKFSDSYGALKSTLKKLAESRKKEHYKDFQKDPMINWILPIFPLFDVGNFLKDKGNRLGFYCWYRGNLVDM